MCTTANWGGLIENIKINKVVMSKILMICYKNLLIYLLSFCSVDKHKYFVFVHSKSLFCLEGCSCTCIHFELEFSSLL